MAHTIGWRYFPHMRAELLIAASRCILASFSLLAIWLDPSEPARYAALAYSMMVGYVVYSLAVIVTVWHIPSPIKHFGLITHGLDLMIFTVFMFFTEGATSPFFVYFVFSVVCAAIRWQWRGSAYTTMIALAAFLGLGFYSEHIIHDPSFELNKFIIRSVYLIVIAMLLSYAGDYLQKMLDDISLLAEWSHDLPHDAPLLVSLLLDRASAVLRAPRALMVWEESEEPWLNVAYWSRNEFKLTRERPDIFGEIVSKNLADKDFLCLDGNLSKSVVLYESGDCFGCDEEGEVLDAALQAQYVIGAALSFKLQEKHFQGRLFVLDKRKMTCDDLVLGKIVAYRITMILNQHYLFEQLHRMAIAEERIRLARDLHDGLLQSLASIGIKAHTADRLMDRDPVMAHEELIQIQKLLSYEQRDLRCLIQELKPEQAILRNPDASLYVRLSELIDLIKNHWRIQVQFKMRSAEDRFISTTIKQDIYFILREALVNAAKHADASTVSVEMGVENHHVTMVVADNGHGFPYFGHYDHETLCSLHLGPVTIRERVAGLGGTLTLDSGNQERA